MKLLSHRAGLSAAPKHLRNPRCFLPWAGIVSLALAMPLLLCSCAAVRQTATTTSTNPTNGVVSVTTAQCSVVAWGDARTIVDKARASAGKTATVGVSGVSEETSSSNAVAGVAEIAAAVVRAAVKP